MKRTAVGATRQLDGWQAMTMMWTRMTMTMMAATVDVVRVLAA